MDITEMDSGSEGGECDILPPGWWCPRGYSPRMIILSRRSGLEDWVEGCVNSGA